MTQAKDDLATVHDSTGWPRRVPQLRALGAEWAAIHDMSGLWPLRSTGAGELGAWIDRFRRHGIVASRRNSPDLLAQLAQALRRPIDTVLCSVLDVDPHACLNSALAASHAIELAAGVLLISRITRAKQAVCVIDSRAPSSWFNELRRACDEVDIHVEPIINDYPQAEPTLLVYSMLGRHLRPGRLPSEMGTVLFDASAAVVVGRCSLLNEPMLYAPLAIRDHVLNRSHYVIAPLGTTIAELCTQLNLPLTGRLFRIGDVLRDIQASSEMLLGGGEEIVHSCEPSRPVNPDSCTRCGWCAESCPTGVHPALVLEATQMGDPDMAERFGLEACIECGICSYVCPSNLPLMEAIRRMRKKI